MTTATGTVQNHRKGHSKGIRLNISSKAYIALAVSLVLAVIIGGLVSIRILEATLQHENNMLVQENECLQAEIDALNGDIIGQTKISNIEKVAVSKLGMVTPTSENCIIIDGEKVNNKNLASAIKEEAYN